MQPWFKIGIYSRRVLFVCIVYVMVLLFTLMNSDSWHSNLPDRNDPIAARSYVFDSFNGTGTHSRRNISLYTDSEVVKHCNCGLETSVSLKQARLAVMPRDSKGFLTIGIPTIKRERGTYVINTIKSLIEHSSAEEREDMVLVVFLADIDESLRFQLLQELESTFAEHIEDSFLHIIHAPESFYPSFDNLKRTYNHGESRVKWRSKQNYDYAYMLKYSINISEYYIQLEDDVITRAGYVRLIREYIDAQTTPWVCLEFSELGFIGKLYRSRDIDKLAIMLMLFFQEQPPDVTFLYFNIMMTQFEQRIRIPTLFQHFGYHSSLVNKIQPLKDAYFSNMAKRYFGDNPPAELYTTMKQHKLYSPKLAYSHAEGYFWAESIAVGQSLLIVFKRPEKIKQIIIETGSEYHPADRIISASMELSPTLAARNDLETECTNYISVGDFKNGTIDVKNIRDKIPFSIFCIRVTITQKHNNWIIFKEIAVFVEKV